ncbi:MAG: sugar ABC transporter ATP-binding protein [Firmicutes bacterium HGW-Firmicutes-7]|nr:MAG: sugar ABC transporter ATP-binding protein [Firmicutes bacterium HGW-Firmicutes-7]
MLLRTDGVTKKFGSMYALKDIDINIEAGEIHGLVGENGAGKSTLIKILTGVYHLDEGSMIWEGKKVELSHPMDSHRLGINVIHQDRNLIPSFNGIENIYLGLDYEKTGIRVNWGKMQEKVEKLIEELGISVSLNKPASSLTPPEKTLLEMIRAMMTECKLLILDEPTASLTDKEAQILFKTVLRLKNKGTSILYVTHRLDEIFQLTDRITVFKNGQRVKTLETKHTDKDGLISLMTDNWTRENYDNKRDKGEVVLSVRNITSRDQKVKDASFEVHAGEILGLFGLGGSGRTELLECIYGLRSMERGCIQIDQQEVKISNPAQAIKSGMVLICEDRRGMALVGGLSVKDNILLSNIDQYAQKGILNEKREIDDANAKIKSLSIKTTGYKQPVIELSGGNQQKVVFAKALMTNPKIFLCDEPTQAVDVKTRAEIHKLLEEKAKEGNAVVFVSSDLKEVLEIADSVQIIAAGRTRDCLVNHNLAGEKVLQCCYVE